jgi:hypothetical protein
VLAQDQLKICDELVELYKAQLKLVETGAPQDWTAAEIVSYDQRAQRIANLQRQFVDSVTVDPFVLKMSHTIPAGSWRDR